MAENTSEPTAPLVVTGMLGGYVTGRVTKQRPLAGVVLAAAGIAAGRRWYRNSGPGTTALLTAIYLARSGPRTRWPKRSAPGHPYSSRLPQRQALHGC